MITNHICDNYCQCIYSCVTYFSCNNIWFIQIFSRTTPLPFPSQWKALFLMVWMEPVGIWSLPPWDQYFAIYRLLSPVFTGPNLSE